VELHRWHGGDHRHIELTLQSLLHDFHVQHAQETATETKAQGRRCLRLPHQGSVVQLQLLHGVAQFFVLTRLYRVNTGKYHRLHIFKALYTYRRTIHVRDGIAYFYFFGILYTGDQVAHIAGTHFLAWLLVQLQHPDLIGLVGFAGVDELHLLPFFSVPL
jgi:hypothetical protein